MPWRTADGGGRWISGRIRRSEVNVSAAGQTAVGVRRPTSPAGLGGATYCAHAARARLAEPRLVPQCRRQLAWAWRVAESLAVQAAGGEPVRHVLRVPVEELAAARVSDHVDHLWQVDEDKPTAVEQQVERGQVAVSKTQAGQHAERRDELLPDVDQVRA